MATALSSPKMTTDVFLAKHVHDDGVEFVNGQIVELPMPGNEHGEVVMLAGSLILQHARKFKLGRVMCNDSMIRLENGNVRGPDVTFLSYRYYAAHLPTPKTHLTPPVDLVIEVLSPSQTYRELTEKGEEFVANGITVAVILDPEVRSAAIYRADELPLRLHNGDIFELPDILPGFRVPVRDFFE